MKTLVIITAITMMQTGGAVYTARVAPAVTVHVRADTTYGLAVGDTIELAHADTLRMGDTIEIEGGEDE